MTEENKIRDTRFSEHKAVPLGGFPPDEELFSKEEIDKILQESKKRNNRTFWYGVLQTAIGTAMVVAPLMPQVSSYISTFEMSSALGVGSLLAGSGVSGMQVSSFEKSLTTYTTKITDIAMLLNAAQGMIQASPELMMISFGYFSGRAGFRYLDADPMDSLRKTKMREKFPEFADYY